MLKKRMPHRMHFIENVYRFIILLILFIFTALILAINISFSRQTRQYTLDYNMSAVKGLGEQLIDQEEFFMQLLNRTYETYYTYKDGLFSHLNSSSPDSYSHRQEIYRFLSESFPSDPRLSAITIYAASDDYIYTVTRQRRKIFSGKPEGFFPLLDRYLDPLTRLSIMPSVSCKELGISQSYSLVYCLRDVFTRTNIGAIQADYSVKGLESFLLNNYSGVKGDFLILDPAGQVLFDTTGAGYDSDLSLSPLFTQSSFPPDRPVRIEGKRYYINMEVLSYPALRIIGMVPQETISADVRRNVTLMLGITSAVTLFTCAGIYVYLHHSTRQLNLIYQSMLSIQNGNLDSYIPIPGKYRNELTEISVSFNQMLENLNLYIDRVYKAEIENQRYQLRILQSQINPHFLYNTLEAIRMKAILNGEPEIGEMVYILSRIFRSSVRTESLTTVRQEIDNCKNYLRLCDIQYQNLFRHSFQIQEVLLQEPIIRHALLVMVENYIMHGFDSNRSDNFLSITGTLEKGHAVFCIRDNGFGISEEELERIRRSFQDKTMDNIERIGLKNIYHRMKLLYQEDCDLRICSRKGQGTEITLSFVLKGSDPDCSM